MDFVLWWRSGFDLSLVIRDPEIESRCRNALQGRRRDLSSQEASLILKLIWMVDHHINYARWCLWIFHISTWPNARQYPFHSVVHWYGE